MLLPCLLPAVLGLASCSSGAETKASPALWLVKDDDTFIYLFGTIHALPDDMDWDDGPVGEAIDKADELVLELSQQEMSLAPQVMHELMAAHHSRPIEDRLPPGSREAYHLLVDKFGLSTARLAGMDDWAVALVISAADAEHVGIEPENGVDAKLAETFMRMGKPVAGLETAREQLTIFETLPPDQQRALLENTIVAVSEGNEQLLALVHAWTQGHETAIDEAMQQDMKTLAYLHQMLVTDRNRRWATWVKSRLDAPGTVIVAVGVGHLVGSSSLQAMLGNDGIKTQRIQ